MRGTLLPTLALLALAVVAVAFGGLEGAGVLALAGAFLVAFAIVLFRRSATDPRSVQNRRAAADTDWLWMLILSGIAVRVAVAVAMRLTHVNEAIAPDEHTFDDNAQWFAAWVRGEVGQPFAYKWAGSTQVGYFALVGSMYAAFGEYPVLPILLNCVVGGLCAYPAYLLTSRLAGRRAGRVAAFLVTFFPSLVLWSALLVRDALVLFLLLWIVCIAQSLLARFRLRTALRLVVCLLLLATLRSYLLAVMGAALVVALLAASVRRPGRALATALVCGAAVVLVVKSSGLGTDYLGDASLRSLALQRQYNAMTGDGAIALEGHDLSTPLGALSYLPMGLAYFLLSPFPWQLAGRQVYAVPEMLLWYSCIPLVVVGAAYALRRRRRQALAPFVAGLLITVLYSLVEGNVGIIFRHRAQALVLLLPFAAAGWVRRRANARVRLRADTAILRRRAGPARPAVPA
jgi:hypothetical protein